MTSSASSQPDRRPWWWHFGPALLLMVVITVASSIPGSSLPPVGAMGWDKVLHALEFAALGAALQWGFARHRVARAWLWAVVCAVSFGVLDELHQALVPGRFPDVFDAMADTVGAVLGVASMRAVLRRRDP